MSLRTFTLSDLIDRNAALFPERPAFFFDEHAVTHREYAASVARLAGGLAAAGVGVGDRIAVLAPNVPAFVDLFGAAARLGAILVPINVRLSTEEVAYVIADVAPRVLVAAPALHALAGGDPPDGPLAFTLGGAQGRWQPFDALYREAAGAADAPRADYEDDAALLIVHTAAVGGRPRGAVLSHRGLLSASLQSGLAWRLGPEDVSVGVLPLFHVAGINLMLAAQHAGGATVVLTRFDPDALVERIEAVRGSVIATFPPMLGALVDAAGRAGRTLSSLRVATGIDVPDTIARFQAACRGAAFWAAYGQTETSGMVSMSPYDERPGSAGRPTALNVVAIVDDTDRPVAAGANGEIVVRGPMVFQGYWGCDADTAFTLRHGWHHTGDMGRVDGDGYLWYAGRSPAKELIKPGGENVYPAEVERTLLEHPDVAAAVVFGVPDAQWGEAVKAVCVPRAGTMLDPDSLIEFVGQRIARYKKPKFVTFVSELPQASGGGVDRAAVKASHGAV
jgi:acyl-CoA synthetase (AMP-forming)/AMP-acid ligase II